MKKIRKFINLFLLLCLILPFYPTYETQTVNADSEEISVGVPTLNIRKGPGLSYPVVGQVHQGEKYDIIGKDGDWYKIDIGSSAGWVAKWLVITENDSGEVGSESSFGKVTVNGLRVRESPSGDSTIFDVLQKGEEVEIVGSVTDWYEIQFQGKKAWVAEEYIQINSNEESNAQTSDSTSTKFGTISVYSLNVRSENSLNGEVIAKVTKGEKYPIIKEENNWYQIKLSNGDTGWVAGWYVEKTVSDNKQTSDQSNSQNGTVTILHNGTNIRAEASTRSKILLRANKGETFSIAETTGEWFAIELRNGSTGYVASWIVSTDVTDEVPNNEESPETNNSNGEKVVVLDPGHGGVDSGTIGVRGTLEKVLTLNTAQLVHKKLERAGIEVIMTRRDDKYISLPSRVGLSHYHDADAFISIHYDSVSTSSVIGHTTYYYHDYQKPLAKNIHSELSNSLLTKDRGIRFGDYHVIRENKQPAVLLELGFLSNAAEEANVNTSYFQDLAANAIFKGINNYLSN